MDLFILKRQMKILIIGDNLGGGGSVLGNSIINEIQSGCYSKFDFSFWFSESISVPHQLEKMNVKPKLLFLRLIPRWISRAIVVRSQKDIDVVLNLTNFPIGMLGNFFKKKGYIEFCLFHNAYFFSLPKSNIKNMSIYFLCREIFMRRLLLYFLYKLFYSDNLRVIVQSLVMKKLSSNFFRDINIEVASFHKPPMVSSTFFPDNDGDSSDFSDCWFYPASGEPHKNHLLLIDLCRLGIARGLKPKVLVTLDEKSRYGSEIIKHIKNNQLENSIINIGWISNHHKLKIYKQCKGVIFLSCFESLGIPLIEARYFNKVVLCAKSDIADEVLGLNYPKFNFTKDCDRNYFLEVLCNISALNSEHQKGLSDGILDAYLINFIN